MLKFWAINWDQLRFHVRPSCVNARWRANMVIDGGVEHAQWDRVENKGSVVVYAGGALVLLWFSSTIVSAVNAVPLVLPSSTCSGCGPCFDFHCASYCNSIPSRALQLSKLGMLMWNYIKFPVMEASPAGHVYAHWEDRHQGPPYMSSIFMSCSCPSCWSWLDLDTQLGLCTGTYFSR